MLKTFVKIQNWVRREEGQGMTEYAMIVGLIAVAILAVIATFTGELTALIGRLTAMLHGIA
ncbi:MAG TPA: hypothetical protein VGK74_28405 [Symbiobacteriaceae bacterium]|jgi:Flp pilus assembly pilin Flp